MKTIQEIIERNDYKKVNEALRIRCDELANIFAKKWESLQLPIWNRRENDNINMLITVNNHDYTLKYNTYWDNFNSYTDGTTFVRVISHYAEEWQPHSIQADSEYMDQAKDTILVMFLNDANDIVQEFDRIESEKVDKINKALNNSKNI